MTSPSEAVVACPRPMDNVWENMCNHADVAHFLQPLPGPASSKPEPIYRPHPMEEAAKALTVFHRRCVTMVLQ